MDSLEKSFWFSLDLHKPPCFKILCEPEAIQWKKNKSDLYKISISLENGNNDDGVFNGETITLTSIIEINIYFLFPKNCLAKTLKLVHFYLVDGITVVQ